MAHTINHDRVLARATESRLGPGIGRPAANIAFAREPAGAAFADAHSDLSRRHGLTAIKDRRRNALIFARELGAKANFREGLMSAEIGEPHQATIRKDVRALAPPPNLTDYAALRASFSWNGCPRPLLDGLPGGRAEYRPRGGRSSRQRSAAERTALRWIGRAGGRLDLTYRELAGDHIALPTCCARSASARVMGVPAARPSARAVCRLLGALKAKA